MLWNNTEPARLFDEFSTHKVSLGFIDSYFIKDFLYKLYKKELIVDDLEVSKIISLQSRDSVSPKKVSVKYNSNIGLYHLLDNFLLFMVRYKNVEFEISYVCIISDSHFSQAHLNDVWIQYEYLQSRPSFKTSINPKDVYDAIHKACFRNSFLKNSALVYKSEGQAEFDLSYLSKFEPGKKEIKDVFLPPKKHEHIDRFIYAIKNYHRDKISLRYLFNGDPGTGKTNIINNIIKKIDGDATVIILSGQTYRLPQIFYFCSFFEPCLLILDDLDLIIGSREERHNTENLSSLLQYLDGFHKNNLFILSTTNLKELVDKAASRPGRFDLILDIAEIDSDNYLQLVERETEDKKIISFFTDEILSTLKLKKASGAFIVNLVKQLTSMQKMNGDLTHSDFERCMDLTYRGFYSSNSEHLKVIGFEHLKR